MKTIKYYHGSYEYSNLTTLWIDEYKPNFNIFPFAYHTGVIYYKGVELGRLEWEICEKKGTNCMVITLLQDDKYMKTFLKHLEKSLIIMEGLDNVTMTTEMRNKFILSDFQFIED